MSLILPALKTSNLQYEKITKATKTEEMRATDLEEAKTPTDFLIFCVAVRELAFDGFLLLFRGAGLYRHACHEPNHTTRLKSGADMHN